MHTMKTLALLLLVALTMHVVVSTSTSGQLSIPTSSLGAGVSLCYMVIDAEAWWPTAGRRRRLGGGAGWTWARQEIKRRCLGRSLNIWPVLSIQLERLYLFFAMHIIQPHSCRSWKTRFRFLLLVIYMYLYLCSPRALSKDFLGCPSEL